MELLYKTEVFEIIGSAIEVHRVLGAGFRELVYHEALFYELRSRGITTEVEKEINIEYKGIVLQKRYFADLVCFDKIIVELKALDELSGREEAQLLNYLKASRLRVGILINFGAHPKLEWKRMVL